MDWRVFEAEPGRSIEAALLADPRDRAAWAVFADFVAGHDPRLGERIQLELRRDACKLDARPALTRQIRDFDRRHRHERLDPGLRRLFDRRGKAPPGVDISWRYGMIFALRLDGGMYHDRPSLGRSLRAVLESPVARFMARLSIDRGTRPKRERDELCATLGAAAPRRALKQLRYVDRHDPLPHAELLAWAPRLEQLELVGRLAHPGHFVQDIAEGRCPELRRLTIPAGDLSDEALARIPDHIEVVLRSRG